MNTGPGAIRLAESRGRAIGEQQPPIVTRYERSQAAAARSGAAGDLEMRGMAVTRRQPCTPDFVGHFLGDATNYVSHAVQHARVG